MCPQTPSLSPEYSHKAGLQAVITSMPLQVRPVIQRRPRGARYNGPGHTWALGLNEAALREDVAAGLHQSAESCEGCPCPFCLCQTSGCSEGLERRVASLPSPQKSSSSKVSSAFSFPFPATVPGISSAAAVASRSMVSISESVASRFTSSAVSASALSASVGAASAAVVLSIAGVFDADASGGVCSITSTT
jgi:hypothetical protein